jgi:hypothetical protein
MKETENRKYARGFPTPSGAEKGSGVAATQGLYESKLIWLVQAQSSTPY